MGKTHSKPLGARHGHGMLCVNRPLGSWVIETLLYDVRIIPARRHDSSTFVVDF